MSQSLQNEAESFARTYAQYWDTPDAASLEHYTTVASSAGRCYTPGCVILTNGEKSPFEVSFASRLSRLPPLIIYVDTQRSRGVYRQRNAK